MSLIQKLFVFLVLAILLPLAVAVHLVTSNSQMISDGVTSAIRSLEGEFAQNLTTAGERIGDESSLEIDRLTQRNWERLTLYLASKIADFLHARDDDLHFLAKILATQANRKAIVDDFRNTKTRLITINPEFSYDKIKQDWVQITPSISASLPIYREISILDLKGNEIVKSSDLSSIKGNVTDPAQTFAKAEGYFDKLKSLKAGEIYVGDVVGIHRQVPKTNSTAKTFRFEGIIRMATPLVENQTIIGYITVALDHRHIMEFSHIISAQNPANKDEVKDNYAVMWDGNGHTIAHPQQHFIARFDPATGKRIPPLTSPEQTELLNQHGVNLRPKKAPTDCYGFILDCIGDGQSNGNYRSFLIDRPEGLKLTTLAPIPYYVGLKASERRSFGYVTININIQEFTLPGAKTDQALSDSFGQVNQRISLSLRRFAEDTAEALSSFQNKLIFVGLFMLVLVAAVIVIASIHISNRVQMLLSKAAEFTTGNLSVRITGNKKDELGRIGQSFNVMANTIETSQAELASINANLECMVAKRTDELRESNQQISDSIDYASRIQRSMLPNDTGLKAILGDTAITWHPKDVVGGDFYWHDTIGNRDYLVVMDCTGHGVPGAFMTLIATSTLEHIVSAIKADKGRRALAPDLNHLMQELHNGICKQLNQVGGGSESNDGLDAIILAIPHDGSAIQYCGAQMDIFTVTEDKNVTRHYSTKKSLGYFNDGVPLNLDVHHLPNDPGTSFVITTDGITTQIGEEKHHCFGYKRLTASLRQAKNNSPKTLNRAIMRAYAAWQGKEVQRDDVTLISFKPSIRKTPGQYHDVLI